MPISYSRTGVRHARALLTDITECGVQAPKALTDLVAAFDEFSNVLAQNDPVAGLVKAVAAGQLRGEKLDKQIAQAATDVQLREFRAGLKPRVEPALIREFITALDEGGAADAVIDSLRPAFDGAAVKLAECAAAVDPGVDPETFLASATAQQIGAWQSIDEHIETLTKISGAVAHFGPHSASFPLLEIPGNTSSGTGFINDRGVLCIDPQWGLERGCRLFLNHGKHRNSPWFKGASVLKLNSIAEAREKIRAWSEAAWDGMNLNQGRGRFDPDKGFVSEPVANPYKLAEELAEATQG